MERRELFKILGATAVADRAGAFQHQHSPPEASSAFTPKFFTAEESFVVDRLADIIIPTDEHSPGAHDAGVIRYIDLVVHYGDEQGKKQWRDWIDAIEEEAKERFSMRFAGCTRDQQEKIVADMAENEGKPSDRLGLFFARLKRLTVDGYYCSPVGLSKEMRYKGNTAVGEFPGCNHPEHQA
jgi:hypothetical protein